MLQSLSVILYALLFSICGASEIYSSFRKDVYLPQEVYPERWCEEPLEGGRVHLIVEADKGVILKYPLKIGLGNVSIILEETTTLPEGLDWLHSKYNSVTGQVWTSLHAHTDSFLDSILSFTVTDSNGFVLVDESNLKLNKTEPDVVVSYVTSQNKFNELVVHIHNNAFSPEIIHKIEVNGITYDTAELHISGGEHRVLKYPVQDLKFVETSVWTVALFSAKGVAAYGGSLTKEIFVMEDWPKSSACPFPVDGASSDNYEIILNEQHIDTHFMGSTCSAGVDSVFLSAANSQLTSNPWFVLPDEYKSQGEGYILSEYYPGIAALFIGKN
jgi:hypothetical protein